MKEKIMFEFFRDPFNIFNNQLELKQLQSCLKRTLLTSNCSLILKSQIINRLSDMLIIRDQDETQIAFLLDIISICFKTNIFIKDLIIDNKCKEYFSDSILIYIRILQKNKNHNRR